MQNWGQVKHHGNLIEELICLFQCFNVTRKQLLIFVEQRVFRTGLKVRESIQPWKQRLVEEQIPKCTVPTTVRRKLKSGQFMYRSHIMRKKHAEDLSGLAVLVK